MPKVQLWLVLEPWCLVACEGEISSCGGGSPGSRRSQTVPGGCVGAGCNATSTHLQLASWDMTCCLTTSRC